MPIMRMGSTRVTTTSITLSFRNTSVESYYAYNEDGINQGYYYLNNFNNIFISGGKGFLILDL